MDERSERERRELRRLTVCSSVRPSIHPFARPAQPLRAGQGRSRRQVQGEKGDGQKGRQAGGWVATWGTTCYCWSLSNTLGSVSSARRRTAASLIPSKHFLSRNTYQDCQRERKRKERTERERRREDNCQSKRGIKREREQQREGRKDFKNAEKDCSGMH